MVTLNSRRMPKKFKRIRNIQIDHIFILKGFLNHALLSKIMYRHIDNILKKSSSRLIKIYLYRDAKCFQFFRKLHTVESL